MSTLGRILAVLALVVVGAFVLILLAAGFVEGMLWGAALLGLQHALGMDTQASHNYAAVSGVLPMMIASLGFSGFAVTLIKHLNCEQPGCWRLGKPHPGHGRHVCRLHFHSDDVAPAAP